jgi:hypothetical protein
MDPYWTEQARFLNMKQREVLLNKLARDTKEYIEKKTTVDVLKDACRDPKVWLTCVYTLT